MGYFFPADTRDPARTSTQSAKLHHFRTLRFVRNALFRLFGVEKAGYPGYAPVIYPSSAWMACSWPEITHLTRSPIDTKPTTE